MSQFNDYVRDFSYCILGSEAERINSRILFMLLRKILPNVQPGFTIIPVWPPMYHIVFVLGWRLESKVDFRSPVLDAVSYLTSHCAPYVGPKADPFDGQSCMRLHGNEKFQNAFNTVLAHLRHSRSSSYILSSSYR